MWLSRSSALKCLQKSLFFYAGGATACGNSIFACGCLCRPHAKIKNQKKQKNLKNQNILPSTLVVVGAAARRHCRRVCVGLGSSRRHRQIRAEPGEGQPPPSPSPAVEPIVVHCRKLSPSPSSRGAPLLPPPLDPCEARWGTAAVAKSEWAMTPPSLGVARCRATSRYPLPSRRRRFGMREGRNEK